jgi:hypothetical protein
MPEQNGSNLKYTTKCRLPKGDGTPCGFPIVDHPLNVQIIGQPDARIQNFLGTLMGHLQKKHPEAWQQINGSTMFFMGYLALLSFETPDPALQTTKTNFERMLRQLVQPPPVTDEEIDKALKSITWSFDEGDVASLFWKEDIRKMLRHMRDYYEGTLPVEALQQAVNLIQAP